MKRTLSLTIPTLAVLTSVAAAQAPSYISIPGTAQSVSTECGIVVVGANGPNVFRWTPQDGQVDIGGPGNSLAGNVTISRDGSTITATTVDGAGIQRASKWLGGTTWVQLPGLGGLSGQSESSNWGIHAAGGTRR